MRRKNANSLNKALKKINGVAILEEPKDYFAVYQLYTIKVLEGKEIRDALMAYLAKKGISTKVYFEPAHKYTIFRKLGYSKIKLPVTEKVSSQVLGLPMYPHMTKREIDYIITSIKEFFEGES